MGERRSFWAAGFAAVSVVIAAVSITFAAARPAAVVGGTAVAAPELPAAGSARTTASAPLDDAGRSTVAAGSPTAAPTPTAAPPPPTEARTTVTAPMATRTVTVPPATVTAEPAPTTGADQPEVPATTSVGELPTYSAAGDLELHDDVAGAVVAVEAYWDHIFTGWDVTWYGPSLWAGDGFYDSASSVPGPWCGDEPMDEMNASYCGNGVPGQGFVSWDYQLMQTGHTVLGDSFVYLVVAHEWAHAAQERFIADGEEPAVVAQQELQADCLAGATLTKAAELGYLELEPGDTDELIESLVAMGDSHSWTGTEDHGSSDERVAWFTKGFTGDIETCLGNR